MEPPTNPRRINWVWPLLGLVACALVAAVWWASADYLRPYTREAEAKQNLHTVQLAVERFAVDHDSFYPPSLGTLFALGYLQELPINPYRRPNAPNEALRRMLEIPLGKHSPGDITYVAHYGRIDSGVVGVMGYTLLVYADKHSRRARPTVSPAHRLTPEEPERFAAVDWNYVLMALSEGHGKGDRQYTPVPAPGTS